MRAPDQMTQVTDGKTFPPTPPYGLTGLSPQAEARHPAPRSAQHTPAQGARLLALAPRQTPAAAPPGAGSPAWLLPTTLPRRRVPASMPGTLPTQACGRGCSGPPPWRPAATSPAWSGPPWEPKRAVVSRPGGAGASSRGRGRPAATALALRRPGPRICCLCSRSIPPSTPGHSGAWRACAAASHARWTVGRRGDAGWNHQGIAGWLTRARSHVEALLAACDRDGWAGRAAQRTRPVPPPDAPVPLPWLTAGVDLQEAYP